MSERRERLLDAAATVFARQGVAGATVAEITDAAGVAKGSFYLEFESKEHLVAALQERYVDQIIERASELVARLGSEDFWALADEFLVAMIDADFEHRDLMAVLTVEAPGLEAQVANANRRLQEIIATGIRVGVAAGMFEVDDPELVAGVLMYGVHGVVRHALLYEEEPDRDRIVAAAREVQRRLLGGPAQPGSA